MKKKLLLSSVLVASLFAKTELSLSVGTNSFAGKEGLDSATSLGIRGDFYLDDLYHVDLGYDDLGSVSIKNTVPSESVKIKRIYTQFSADGKEEYHVVPTLSLGLGYEKRKGDGSANSPFLSLGVGFRYNVSNSFNFLLGTKALWETKNRAINYQTSFGMGYLLGEAPVNNKEVLNEEVIIPEQKLDISTQIKPEPIKQMPIEVVIPDSKETIVTKQIVPTQIVQQPVSAAPQQQQLVQSQDVILPTVPAPVMQKRVVSTKRGGTYIQVAAYSKIIPRKTLDRLAKSGNHIVLRHQGKITRALVGPYSSRASALKAMAKVKRVAPRAFIYKGN